MALARSTSSSLLLLAVLLSSWCAAIAARPAPSDAAAAAGAGSFVRSWCAGTEYPSLCDATLAPYAGAVGASPARMAWAALTVAMGGARNATAAMRGMAAAAGGHGLGPVAAEAAQDCVSMLGDAVGMLRQSADAMARLGEEEDKGQQVTGSGGGGSSREVRFQVDSVQTWASAALTDADMCIEGFRGEAAGGGGAREAVRGHVAGVQHLAANALGIVNSMAKQIP